MEELCHNAIGIYVGSFDPFHKGHQAICDYLLDNKIISMIYVLGNAPSKFKPNRSSLNHRINMINLQLKTSKNIGNGTIIVSDEPADNVILKLSESPLHNLCLILGSDRYLDCVEKNKRPLGKNSGISDKFDQYIVVQRNGSKDLHIDTKNIRSASFFDKPCRIFNTVEFQESSSTDVRDGNMNLVCEKTKQYIQKHHLYETERIKKIFPIHDQLTLCDGLSGNSTYRIVIKEAIDQISTQYVKFGYRCDVKSQIDAYQYFGKINAKYIEPNILIMSEAKGYSLTDVLNDVHMNLQPREFARVGCAIGRFIKNFHMSKTFETNVFEHKFYQKIVQQCTESPELERFKIDPGIFHLIHGDLSPNNIFIDIHTMEVTLIDLDKFVEKSKTGGSAMYEYFQLLSGINWNCNKQSNIDNFMRGFVTGYGDCGDVASDHVYKMCREYWAMKGSLMLMI